MRQRCDPSALIQWLSFNRPSPHFNFQFLRAVETVSELRSWCYSIDCDEACVIKKKKKREKFRENSQGLGIWPRKNSDGVVEWKPLIRVQPCRLRSKPRSFGYEKIPVSNFRIEFESFCSTCSQSPKKKRLRNIDLYRGHMFTPRETNINAIKR